MCDHNNNNNNNNNNCNCMTQQYIKENCVVKTYDDSGNVSGIYAPMIHSVMFSALARATSDRDTKDESKDHELNRLVMINPEICMLCRNRDSGTRQLEIGYRWGWIYCKDCMESKRINRAVTSHFDKNYIIPLQWLNRHMNYIKHNANDEARHGSAGSGTAEPNASDIKSTDSDDEESEDILRADATLQFFRYSQRDFNPMYTALLRTDGYTTQFLCYSQTNCALHMVATFVDKKTGQECERSVSLQNLFKHNPDLYTDLTSCRDLFGYGPKVGYMDLSHDLRQLVEQAYADSQSPEPYQFLSSAEKR